MSVANDFPLSLMSDAIFDQFKRVPAKLDPDFIHDFMGLRSHVDFNGIWIGNGGVQQPVPLNNWQWISLLWAVASARHSGRGRAVLMECGAGWGPWIGAGFGAARQMGIETIRLIGVEGHQPKVATMVQHFANNGATPENLRAVHGIVAAESGIAFFPVALDPSMQWGARVRGQVGTDRAKMIEAARAVPMAGQPGVYTIGARHLPYDLVPAYTLSELMGDHEMIDYIHFDIQGSEGPVIETSIADMTARVRVICVGTHSGDIEAALRILMPAHGWVCLRDEPQPMHPRGKLGDGTQVWLNRRFLPTTGPQAVNAAPVSPHETA